MSKLLVVLVACILIQTPTALAQARSPEVFVGYTNLQSEGLRQRNDPSGVFDTDFFRSRGTMHGVNASLSGFWESGIGLTGDLSWARQRRNNDITGGEVKRHTDTSYFLGGPTIKWNRGSDSRVQPFVRVMAGAAHTKYEASSVFQQGGGTVSRSFEVGATDFAAAAGGGLDVGLGENIKLRLVQVDWAPVFLRDRSVNILGDSGVLQTGRLNKQRQDNFRFSFGIVF